MERIPERVDVLGVAYDVAFDSTEPGEDGYCSPSGQRIGIRPGMGAPKTTQVFYHELVHAILGQLAYDDLYEDERLVQGLAIGLHQALGDLTSSS